MSTRSPSITIGVPAYNASKFLAACLDSLLAQDHGDFILLIADNASSDGTDEICRRYAALDRRVRHHRHSRNIGMYGNMNFLLRSATTPYVKLANADDFWAPTMVSDALRVLEADPEVELAYPMMTLVNEAGVPIQDYEHRLHVMDPDPAVRFKRVLSEIGLVSQLMGVMRTATVRRMRPLRNIPGEDIPFVAEISLYGRIFQTSRHDYLRRMHRDSSSFDRVSDQHQARHVLAAGATGIHLSTWRIQAGLLSRILRSPVRPSVKAHLLAHVGRRIVWNRRALGRELIFRG